MDSMLRIFLLLAMVCSGLALKCYVCTSLKHPDCYESPIEERKMECSDKNTTHPYAFCRKLHMYMDQDYGKVLKAGDRIHRDCAYISDADVVKKKGSCYYKSGFDTRTWVCSCEGDYCNSATDNKISAVGLVASAAAALLALRR